MGEVRLVERDIASLRPYARNARTHSKKQIKQIAASIERFGFTNPVLMSDDGEIIAGHGRVEAAKLLGCKTVPTLALSHLSEAERRAYVLADNKLALNAGWDREILAIELQALVDLEFDVELTGFSLAEIDLVLDEAGEADPDGSDAPEDVVPAGRRHAGDPRGRPLAARSPSPALRRYAQRRGHGPADGRRARRPRVHRSALQRRRSTATSAAWARSSIASSRLPAAR